MADFRKREGSVIDEVYGKHAISERALVTRWKPVDLACETADHAQHQGEEIIVRTKLVRGPRHAAVCVSEAVSHCVLGKLGLTTVEAFAVNVGEDFARQLTRQFEFEREVAAGRHWGTRRLQRNALSSKLTRENIETLSDRRKVFTLYLGDVILAHRDRSTDGNILFVSDGSSGLVDLVPIDQSDCFCGPDTLRDPVALEELAGRQVHDVPDGMEGVLLGDGAFIAEEFQRVQALKEELLECISAPCEEWYDRAGIDPAALREVLDHRIDGLWELAQMEHWSGMCGAVGGGHVLDFD